MRKGVTMKVLFIQKCANEYFPGQRQFMEGLSQEKNVEISCLTWPDPKQGDLISEIRSQRPDLLITTDLAGFEQCTLADNISYNLLDCKQIHLLLHEKLPNEPYLKGQLSIAMFFYCAGDTYCDYLTQKYHDLPWLKELSDWQEGTDRQAQESNAETLGAVFREVLQECGLQP